MNTPAIALLIVTISVPMPVETLVAQAETASSASVWDFDRERPGTLPGDFSIQTLFDGRPAGEWRVVATDRAKSPPHVLAQLMAKGAEHAYKMLLVKGVIAADLDLRVSFLPIHGQADMGGGLTWRAADDRNLLSRTSQSVGTKYPDLSSRQGCPAPITKLRPDDRRQALA